MQKKTVVKHKFKTYFISFLAIFLMITSFFLIYSSLNIKTSSNVALLTYSEKSNLDYKVYLKKNDYFKEKYLPKNRQYIASIIDYIDVFYDYTFSSSKHIDAKYKYKVVAKINAQYKVDTNSIKQVWQDEYVLSEGKELEIKDKNTFTIDIILTEYHLSQSISNRLSNLTKLESEESPLGNPRAFCDAFFIASLPKKGAKLLSNSSFLPHKPCGSQRPSHPA